MIRLTREVSVAASGAGAFARRRTEGGPFGGAVAASVVAHAAVLAVAVFVSVGRPRPQPLRVVEVSLVPIHAPRAVAAPAPAAPTRTETETETKTTTATATAKKTETAVAKKTETAVAKKSAAEKPAPKLPIAKKAEPPKEKPVGHEEPKLEPTPRSALEEATRRVAALGPTATQTSTSTWNATPTATANATPTGNANANASAERASLAADYVARIQAAVQDAYAIPPGISGVREAAVRIHLDPDGRVVARALEVASGDRAFDAALLAVLDRLPPLPPPAEIAAAARRSGVRVWFRSDHLARGART